MKLTLDVGCGVRPQGTVNVDIYIGASNPYTKMPSITNPKKIPNFVKADGQFLPFRSNIFDEVYCFHVIEHVENPYLLLRELLRVARGTVHIKTPHRLSKYSKTPYHKHYFNRTWFSKVLKNYRTEITLSYEPLWPKFPYIQRPLEIQVKIIKRPKNSLKKLGTKRCSSYARASAVATYTQPNSFTKIKREIK